MREADCRLRAIAVFLQTMIEKREGFACAIATFSQGLKPTGILTLHAALKRPHFHANFRLPSRSCAFCRLQPCYGFGIPAVFEASGRFAGPHRLTLLVLVRVIVLALSVMARRRRRNIRRRLCL